MVRSSNHLSLPNLLLTSFCPHPQSAPIDAPFFSMDTPSHAIVGSQKPFFGVDEHEVQPYAVKEDQHAAVHSLLPQSDNHKHAPGRRARTLLSFDTLSEAFLDFVTALAAVCFIAFGIFVYRWDRRPSDLPTSTALLAVSYYVWLL